MKPSTLSRCVLLSAVALGLMSVSAPREARACGGMFCDNAQQPMPVDQTGEVIVFAVTNDQVEAHIQIQYDPNTEASRFAWIVPVTAAPEITVGSEQLFLNVQNATVPAYGFQSSFEFCDYGGDYGGGYYGGGGCTDSGGAASGGGFSGGDGSGGPGGEQPPMMGGTEVLQQASVGAFDFAVLDAPTVDDLMTWLADNDYYQDPVAAPILEEYIEEGHLFVAFRLTQGTEVGEIHPIVITYPGNEPCVPIRLTRIAAQDDMDIRAFFLSEERFAPTNYKHVVVNPLKLDHFQFAGNYKEAVTAAIDGPEAEGHAFVTEFAGPSEVVDTETLFNPQWSSSLFVDATPLTVVGLLEQAELYRCIGDVCETFHPLVPGLLAKHVPVPDGVEPDAFYSCVECFEQLVDMDAWDAAAFVADLEERIIKPAEHAVALFSEFPYLTRLYTTLSPAEMTVDPVFHETEGLGAVDLTNSLASVFTPCAGTTTATLDGYTAVSVPEFQVWPDVAPESMPWAARVEQVLPLGSPQVLLDNREIIEQLIADWNSGMMSNPAEPSLQPRCDDGSGSGQGCGCRTDDDGDSSALFGLLVLVGLAARRRR